MSAAKARQRGGGAAGGAGGGGGGGKGEGGGGLWTAGGHALEVAPLGRPFALAGESSFPSFSDGGSARRLTLSSRSVSLIGCTYCFDGEGDALVGGDEAVGGGSMDVGEGDAMRAP